MRSKKIIKNAMVSLGCEVINIFIQVINRTIFIYTLGVNYLGINGLFANVLMILSLAELGIGEAINYSLYKPLAIGDKEKIKSLVRIYRTFYKWVTAIIGIIGVLIIPFISLLIKEPPNIPNNLILIYLLFLINSCLSYCYANKKSVISADQKNYIISLYTQLTFIVQSVLQITVLLLTKNYILYLVIKIIITLSTNIILTKKADKIYPYLKDKKVFELETEEKKILLSNIKNLFFYRVGYLILGGTDNIIISLLIGIKAVGMSSNYILIISALKKLSSKFLSSFIASVGNINAVGNLEKKESTFNKVFLITAWIQGFLSIGLFLLLDDLIINWLGEKYLLSKGVVFSMVLYFYVDTIRFPVITYRKTLGLFREGRLIPLAASAINIVLSIVLGIQFGLMGIYLATSIARLLTYGIVEPILIYTKVFEKHYIEYYKKYFLFFILNVSIYMILEKILTFITISGIYGFILKIFVVTLIFNSLMFGIFCRNKDFIEIRKIIINILNKRLGKDMN